MEQKTEFEKVRTEELLLNGLGTSEFEKTAYLLGWNKARQWVLKNDPVVKGLVEAVKASCKFDESSGVNHWGKSEPERQRYDYLKKALSNYNKSIEAEGE